MITGITRGICKWPDSNLQYALHTPISGLIFQPFLAPNNPARGFRELDRLSKVSRLPLALIFNYNYT